MPATGSHVIGSVVVTTKSWRCACLHLVHQFRPLASCGFVWGQGHVRLHSRGAVLPRFGNSSRFLALGTRFFRRFLPVRNRGVRFPKMFTFVAFVVVGWHTGIYGTLGASDNLLYAIASDKQTVSWIFRFLYPCSVMATINIS